MRDAKRLASGKSTEDGVKVYLARTREDLAHWAKFLSSQKVLATDIEAASNSPWLPGAATGCVGFAWNEQEAVVIPVDARVGVDDIEFSPGEALTQIKGLWENPDIRHALHFGSYDVMYVKVVDGIQLANYWFDTGLGSYAMNVQKGIHGLKSWARRMRMGGYERPRAEYMLSHPEANPSKGGDANQVPGSLLYPYNGRDCVVTYRVMVYQEKLLKQRKLYNKPFRFPLMWHNWTAALMEENGLNLDMDLNTRLLEEFPRRVEGIDAEIFATSPYKRLVREKLAALMEKAAEVVEGYKKPPPDVKVKTVEVYKRELAKVLKDGPLVKLNHAPVRRRYLYGLCGLSPALPSYEGDQAEGMTIVTKTGEPTTEAKYLKRLQKERYPDHRELRLIIQRGQWESARSKYVSPIASWRGTDGRAHTEHLVHGQVTGRISSKNPNLENLPKRADESRREIVALLRRQFVCSGPEYVLLEMDEAQIEMRLFADRANDGTLIQQFNEGRDPHRMGAAAGYEIPERKVTKKQRSDAKNAISFGLLYGRSAAALALDMGWSQAKAEEFKERYFTQYDGCRDYIRAEGRRGERDAWCRSYFGRYSEFPELLDNDSPGWLIGRALRQLINRPIQGDASDITWCAGYRLGKLIKRYSLKSRLVNGVHDSLWVDTYRPELAMIIEVLYKYMTDRDWLEKKTGWRCQVPLDVGVAVGVNLDAMVELEHKANVFDFQIPEEFK